MKKIFVIISLLALSFMFAGCAHSRSYRSESETTRQVEGGSGDYTIHENAEANRDAATVEHKEVKEKETVSEHPGLLGSTLHLIGQILAFPFKVIAGAIEFIF